MTDTLVAAQVSLQAAVDQLTRPQTVKIDREGVTEYVKLPPLLDQLSEAAESSTSRGAAAGSVYKAPAALDVLALLAEIDTETLWGLRASGDRRRWLSLGLQLRAWAARAGAWRGGVPPVLHLNGLRPFAAQAYLLCAADNAQQWVTRARQILAPEQATFEVQPRPCPRCQTRTVLVWSPDHGERVQKSSLFFDKAATTVRCRDCGAAWGADLFDFLARLLGDIDARVSA